MSDSEVFSIKDPRPITAKFSKSDHDKTRPRIYFSDSSEQSDERECVTSPHLQESEEGLAQGSEKKGEMQPTTAKKSKGRKDKIKKKGYKRSNTHPASSSVSSIYIKSNDLEIKLKKSDKLSKSDNILKARKPKRKKKSPVSTHATKFSIQNLETHDSTTEPTPDSQEDQEPHPSTEETPPRKKPNFERIAKLSERKNCNRSEGPTSWVNPMLGNPVVMDTDPGEEQNMEVITESDPQPTDDTPQPHSTSPRGPRVRYTNLSLSMPTTREGRRKEDDDPSNNWLFECKNIWSSSTARPGHHSNYQYDQTQYQSVDLSQGYRYANTRTPVAMNPSSVHLNKSNRFIYSMNKNKPASRGQIMRTVKQGSFVLLGTVKSIRDEKGGLGFTF